MRRLSIAMLAFSWLVGVAAIESSTTRQVECSACQGIAGTPVATGLIGVTIIEPVTVESLGQCRDDTCDPFVPCEFSYQVEFENLTGYTPYWQADGIVGGKYPASSLGPGATLMVKADGTKVSCGELYRYGFWSDSGDAADLTTRTAIMRLDLTCQLCSITTQ